ncbi:tau 95 subunit of transcription factor TFIIIC [Rhizina undulata]
MVDVPPNPDPAPAIVAVHNLHQPLPPATAAAEWLPIPERRIICIEHPARIRDVQKAIATIGGQSALVQLAVTNGNSGLNLRFRPEDPMQPPIQSRTVPTNNILLKVTIPKRRKKKKPGNIEDTANTSINGQPAGRQGPEPKEQNEQEQQTLLDKLRVSKGKYEIEAVGMIERTVRFRDMANYQCNYSNSHFVKKVENHMLHCDFEQLSKFELGQGRGYQPDLEILSPPAFSNTVMQHTYYYRQNPAIKKAIIRGAPQLLNLQAAPKTLTPMVHISTPHIPPKPASVPDYNTLDSATRQCVDHLRALFETRPIWTRRALFNHFPKHLQSLVRFSMVHVAYMWRAGPWRDTCVIYGLDPRSSPEYRKYQSVFFQVETEKAKEKKDAARTQNSHIFDGKGLIRDGRCFQLCDITDPLLKRLINTDKMRKTCDTQDGWYRSSTMLKIKSIMRAKIRSLVEGVVTPDAEFVSILEQESEDEEQEATRKAREAKEREEKKKKRQKGKKSASGANVGDEDIEMSGVGDSEGNATNGRINIFQAENEVEEYDDEVDGDWEVELDIDESTFGAAAHKDPREQSGRVDQLMTELLGAEYMNGYGGYDAYLEDGMQDEGDFDVLGEDELDEGDV